MVNSYQPIEDKKRTVIVDILRGWALLGVVLGNYIDYSYIGIPIPTNTKSVFCEILNGINQLFFVAKSWTLLSVLFGYGFAVLINNVTSKGKNPVAFFAWRMFILFILAFINSAFWWGDILKDYAFLGLVLLMFYKCSAKTIRIMFCVLLLAIPFLAAYFNTIKIELPDVITDPKYLVLYHSTNLIDVFKFNLFGTFYGEMINVTYASTVHLVMFTCMLMGFYAQKIDFFNRLTTFKKQLKHTLFISFFIPVIIGLLYAFVIDRKAQYATYFTLWNWLIISTMIFIATSICLFYCNNKLKKFFNYLRFAGKMTLSNYIVQNILSTLIFSGVGLKLYNTMPFWFYFILAVIVFIIQLFISKWWLTKYNYGPAEWLWRVLSYRKSFPFKKVEPQLITNDLEVKTTE